MFDSLISMYSSTCSLAAIAMTWLGLLQIERLQNYYSTTVSDMVLSSVSDVRYHEEGSAKITLFSHLPESSIAANQPDSRDAP